jgi:putative hydrolase of the HAD superfamily
MPDSPYALLFDFDGLMVDTEYAIYEAWRDLYRSQGHDLPLETYVQCVGSTFATYSPMDALEQLLGHTPDWPTLLAEKNRSIQEKQQFLDAMPGIRELLNSAREKGIRTAVASSSDSGHVYGWLEKLDLRRWFDTICTREDVERAKPAPDLFLLAMERLGVAAKNSLVLEDSRNGLLAATAAGVACVVVPNRTTSTSDFTGAALRLETLEGWTADRLFEEINP